MNAITTAIRYVKKEIPKKILNIALLSKTKAYRVNTTLDKQIEDIIIADVLLDCNLVGGITMTIDINNCYLSQYVNNDDNVNCIITVPDFKSKIIQPLSLTANLTYGNENTPSSTPINNMLDTIHTRDQQSLPGEIFTDLTLIARNTILITEDVFDITTGYLEVMVENDKSLNNISTRSYLAFAELVVLATKAYIFNELTLELEDGALYYGHNVSKISSTVDSYESSMEEYKNYLKTTWAKIAFMNDTSAMSEHLSLLTSASIKE